MGDANMGSPEFGTGQDGNRGKGGKTLGFTPRGVAPQPELPIDTFPGRTAPEARPEPRKKGIGKGIRNAIIAGAALTTLGGAGYVAYQEIPEVHRLVDDRIPGTPIEEKFPIKLEQSLFTPVSETEMGNLWKNTKTLDLEKHTFTIGFPVDQATIDKSPNLRMNHEFDTFTLTPDQAEKLQKQGFKTDTQISGFPKDAKIYYRYDATKFDASIIKITIAGEIQGEGSNSFEPAYTTYRVILRDKQTGKQYEGGIDVLYGKPLVNPAPFPTDHHPVYEDGTPIKPDEPIVQLTTDLQDWDGRTGYPLPGQKGQVVIASVGGGYASIGDAISDAQKGIFNPDYYLTTSFLTNPNTNTIATKQ